MQQRLWVADGTLVQTVDRQRYTLAAGTDAEAVRTQLARWAEAYRAAAQRDHRGDLIALGRAMLAWLNPDGRLDEWGRATPQRRLEIDASVQAGPLTDALLAAPWELLATETNFLASDARRDFIIERRCVAQADPLTPPHADLSIWFMAAAPDGASSLNFETEEAAIVDATRDGYGQPLARLVVEESGNLKLLAERLVGSAETADVLHLSCHGDMNAGPAEGPTGPQLVLETLAGDAAPATATDLQTALQDKAPPLLFLSACSTAASAADRRGLGMASYKDGSNTAPVDPDTTIPLARDLSGCFANVLGWDGLVYDRDATVFAQNLYGELAKGVDIGAATARARRAVLNQPQDAGLGAGGSIGGERHWHRARLYLGAGGGGPLTAVGQPKRPQPPVEPAAFLDKRSKIKVATANEFIGRRRRLQAAIRCLRGQQYRGVLIHGTGGLGKSSLAARLVARLAEFRPAVVFGSYDAHALWREITNTAKTVITDWTLADRTRITEEWDQISQSLTDARDESATTILQDGLGAILRQVFHTAPLLLILDDFEQALDKERTYAAIYPQAMAALRAVLAALRADPGRSRLIITSRYDFDLPSSHGGPTQPLLRIPLAAMDATERNKQWQAKARALQAVVPPQNDKEWWQILNQAVTTASGNARLQNYLTTPLLQGERPAAQAAITTAADYLAGKGITDVNSEVADFLRGLIIEHLGKALSASERDALDVCAVFKGGVPIPVPALVAAIGAVEVIDAAAALARLQRLGLVEGWGDLPTHAGRQRQPHAALAGPARQLVQSSPDLARIADAALPLLAAAWCNKKGHYPRDPRAEIAATFALAASETDLDQLGAAAFAALYFWDEIQHDARAAWPLAQAVMARFQQAEHPPHPGAATFAIAVANTLGQRSEGDAWISQALANPHLSDLDRAGLLGSRAMQLSAAGDVNEALDIWQNQVLPIVDSAGQEADAALIRAKIGQLLANLDRDHEAFERLYAAIDVLDKLGKQRLAAMARGAVAAILAKRQQYDEALTIMRNQVLPVYEALNDRPRIANQKLAIVRLVLRQGESTPQKESLVEEYLSDAWNIFNELKLPAGIAAAGRLVGQALARIGETDAAITVLEQAAAAQDFLGHAEAAQETRAFIKELQEQRDART